MILMAEERPGAIERAFQVARSGTVATLGELQAQLAAEGYDNAAQLLSGRSLTLQLSRMIAEARS
jgi:hypothetical protein